MYYKWILNKREYLGPVWPADVWPADDIPFCSIFPFFQYSLIHDLALSIFVFFFSGFQLQKWRYDRQYQHQYSSLPCSGLEFRNRIQSANLFNTTRRSSVKTCSFWNFYFTGLYYYSFLLVVKKFLGHCKKVLGLVNLYLNFRFRIWSVYSIFTCTQ